MTDFTKIELPPRTPHPDREAWEQAAIEDGHEHYVTSDLTGFLTPLGGSDRIP